MGIPTCIMSKIFVKIYSVPEKVAHIQYGGKLKKYTHISHTIIKSCAVSQIFGQICSIFIWFTTSKEFHLIGTSVLGHSSAGGLPKTLQHFILVLETNFGAYLQFELFYRVQYNYCTNIQFSQFCHTTSYCPILCVWTNKCDTCTK